MGLFSKKKNSPLQMGIPIKGKIVDITEVPDDVFAQKYMGDGVAIYPTEGKVYSPADGEIIVMAETGHAIGIRTKEGVEFLIHVGLDTVDMKGEGFKNLVAEGDKVKRGQSLLSFDLELVKERAKSTVSPIIITNMEAVERIEKNGLFESTDILITVFIKK
ncbi:MAG: glucose transporter subunit [Clostridia bacterium]|jgi:PTS system glucose-specific IIA component|nr:glucose transporter subunit [Clostridia bacterium]